MLEAVCSVDGETFVPDSETDLTHAQREDGTDCGARGTLLGQWVPRPPSTGIIDLGAEDDARRAAAGLAPYWMSDEQARRAGYDD